MISFNPDEVYEMAEHIERGGAAYYRSAAETVDDAQLKRLLLDLADMEDQHEATFHQMRQELPAPQRTGEQFDPTGEGALYLHAMVQGKLFGPVGESTPAIVGSQSPGDILKKAIEMEKNSILFYLTVKKMIQAEASRAKVDEIIDQEMGHVATLSGQLAEAG